MTPIDRRRLELLAVNLSPRRLRPGLLAGLVTLGLVVSGAAVPAAAFGASGALTGAPAATAPAAGVSLGTLEVENRSEPLGIDVAAPRLSWVTSSAARDVTQTSYRIRVATTEADLASGAVWDSGVVASDASTAVAFGGAALAPATDYVWQVDVETSAGASSARSTFSTGLFDDADWAGSAWIGNARHDANDAVSVQGSSWIWTPEAGAPSAPAEPRAFRKTLVSPAGLDPVSAEIVITADDSYTLWLNGEELGKTTGAVNEWQGAKLFTVDLSESDSDPVVAVRTNNGPNSPAGLLAAIEVTYSDGSAKVFRTDADWKAVKVVPSGFEAAGFDDSAWPAAAVQAVYGSGPWGSGVRPPTPPVAPAPLLRKEFTVDGGAAVASAKFYVAAGGYANVSLNGAPINDEILSPGFTDYDDHAQYTVTDVTTQLQPGANAIGLELGRGFYGMTNPNVWNWQSPPFHDEPVGRALLRIQYTDGTTKDVVTDDSWKLHDGPTLVDDLYGGERYDARKAQPGFDTVGFAARGWVAASEVAGPKGELMNQQQQPIRVTEELPAESVTEVADGDYVVKFPRVLAGTVRFTAEGAAGTSIRAQYGEKLLADGRPNFSNNGGFANGFQTDTFTLAGTGTPESWGGKFSYKGFQYIEVTGWPGGEAPSVDAFTALALHTDAPETGSFESSDRIMNETHRAVVDTLLNNIHSIPTDTPMFEKNGWTGDAAVGAEMFLMNLDTQNLFEKWIGDINDSRDAAGAPLVIAPSSDQWGQWGVATPWHSAYILIPWWLYQYGGDIQVLEKYYDGMKGYVDLEFGRSPGGVVPDNRLGDWVSPEASPAGGNAPEDSRVSGTAYLYTMLTSMQKTASLLGNADDAAHFAANAAVVKEGFNKAFLDPAAGYYRGSGDNGYRQTHNALALAFDLAPDAETAQRVADSLAADVVAKGDKLNTGSLGSKYLLPMLTQYGHADLAYKVAVQTEYPSWGYMIENGATTMWEHWSLDARSRGHYFLGTVDDWFYHDVAGIRSSETTGYRDITIAPAVTDQLAWAKATTQTPFGPVSTDWKRTGDTLTLATHVPVGSTAVVHVPAANRWAVTEGGRMLDQVDGVRSVSEADGSVLVTIGSGDYSFVVDDRAEAVGAVIDRIDALAASIDAALTAGAIDAAQRDEGQALVAATRSRAAAALDLAGGTDDVATARGLTEALAALDAIDGPDGWIERLGDGSGGSGGSGGDGAISAIAVAAAAVRTELGVTISTLLHVTATATPARAGFKPGEAGAVTVAVSNGGTAEITDVQASLEGLDEGWAVEGDPTPIAASVAAGAEASADLGFTVPLGQVPGAVPASVPLGYEFAGSAIALALDASVGVDSPVQFSSVTLDPSTVAPGGVAELVAVVSNSGTQPAAGHLEVSVPSGWAAPLPTATLIVPGGSEATVRVPVAVPLAAANASSTAQLTADFVHEGTMFASAQASLTVTLAPLPAIVYDHVDLGDSASEQAHGLTASSSSGTNSEAGLTRRYAGHLTDFSYFEFDTAVKKGSPFLLRVTETYDRAQTKKYKVYVDGEEITTRQFSHTTGVGTETYELVVDASHAAGDTVRVRFENLDDHAFYDPSIADVLTLPVPADTTAPQVVATTTPSAPNPATGWFTSAPVGVAIAAQDDRGGDAAISAGTDGGALAPYTGPLSFDADGAHTVSFQAQDEAGNTSAPQTAGVKIDTRAPETTATLGDGFDGSVASGPGTVDLSATDATSGVSSTSYRVASGDWQTLDGTSVVVTEPGAFTLEFRSTDVAGNVEEVGSISGEIVIPDTTAPVVSASISNEGLNGWHLAGAELTLTATDDETHSPTVSYRLGDGDWAAYTAPVALPEGVVTVQYRASDTAGNVSAAVSVESRVDGIAPTVWGWLSPSGRVTTVATDADASAGSDSASDAGSGIARVQYSLDGDAWIDGLSALIAQGASPSSVVLRAVDLAGNMGSELTLTRSETPAALTVTPGASILVEGSGFLPGQTVRLELHSEVAVLGTAVADARGVVAAVVTVPADFPGGEHSLVLVAVAADGGDSGGSDTPGGSVTVPADVLASTGLPVWSLALGAGLVLALGAVLLLVRRARRSDAAPGGRHSAG
ncbi:glycoside hydrolase family 78 protein [Herbiconiux sp. CPCC 205763]|uniref:alpha-L-rhamnosidase n=1 Tax=Herbiconiux aconitum TaxID=2970913 RepID=A0ABT2GUG7_9MICO|nr:glycoside hydrolase family 78 protein [Herbiconiux aconitum]MCS5719863.1 glycoside hydrolase family 78 protein [Herbiconiux aconitum]